MDQIPSQQKVQDKNNQDEMPNHKDQKTSKDNPHNGRRVPEKWDVKDNLPHTADNFLLIGRPFHALNEHKHFKKYETSENNISKSTPFMEPVDTVPKESSTK